MLGLLYIKAAFTLNIHLIESRRTQIKLFKVLAGNRNRYTRTLAGDWWKSFEKLKCRQNTETGREISLSRLVHVKKNNNSQLLCVFRRSFLFNAITLFLTSFCCFCAKKNKISTGDHHFCWRRNASSLLLTFNAIFLMTHWPDAKCGFSLVVSP